MINLLPPETRDAYRYAQKNVSLVRWAVVCFAGLVGVGLIATYGLVQLHQSTRHYQSQVNEKQSQLTKDHFAATEAQVQDISRNLKLAVQVLSKEVLFSKLLKQMATAIPPNANLTGLDINQTEGGLDITADATDYSTATQVQVNLSNPANKIFSKADIESISCGSSTNSTTSTTPVNSQYPCTVQIRALFAPNNPFLFINSQGKR